MLRADQHINDYFTHAKAIQRHHDSAALGYHPKMASAFNNWPWEFVCVVPPALVAGRSILPDPAVQLWTALAADWPGSRAGCDRRAESAANLVANDDCFHGVY